VNTVLAIVVLDEKGSPLQVRGARLIDPSNGTLAAMFKTNASNSADLDVTSTANGDYELRTDIKDLPTNILSVRLFDRGGAKALAFRGTTPRCATVASKKGVLGKASSNTVVTLTLKLAAKHQEVVLVSGWDYSGGSRMALYALTYRDDLARGVTNHIASATSVKKKVKISQGILDHNRVTLFSFQTGMRTRWLKGQKGWHTIDEVLQGTVPTHTGKYDDPVNMQKRHDDDAISIVHVYQYIADLGCSHKGCVTDFQVFSHSWDGGPILVDTYQASPYRDGEPKEDERDPGDKDGRTKDFTAKNMPNRADFKAAFASHARIKIWGCLAATDYRDLILAAERARSRGIPSSQPLTVNTGGKTIKVSQDEIKDYFVNKVLPHSYMKLLANLAGSTVYGAPSGAGSNLMQIGRGNYMYVDQATYAKLLRWFDQVLHLKHDSSGFIPYG